jgi:SAM-dependent methyltransferase
VKHRDTCAVCGSAELQLFLYFPEMPLAGGFLHADEVDREQLYTLDVAYCAVCGLVQVLTVVGSDVLFSDYRYSSSTTTTLSSHFERYAEWLKNRLDPGLVVEFGCNDGVLLDPLQRRGVRAVGIDPAANVATLARARGLDVVGGFFDADSGARLRGQHGPADVVTGSNVFAHIDDIHAVMKGVDALLADDGAFIVEVHYLADIVRGMQFDSIYHEHLYYYSIHSLAYLFGMYDLSVVEVIPVSSHGGSVRVVARRAAASPEVHPSVDKYLAAERYMGLGDPGTYAVLQDRWDGVLDALRAELAGRDLCAYGAAGRAVMLLSMLALDNVAYVIDESPLRAGRVVPKLHIPIEFPARLYEDPRDACLITAWTYRDEIMRKEPYYRGEWITPLPNIEKRRNG